MAYDPTTPAGKVRLLISDTDPDNEIFNDTEITTFLDLEADDVRVAAALALETIASNTAQVLQVIKVLDLEADGTKVSTELRARAKDLREQSNQAADFDWAEMVINPWDMRTRLVDQFLREGA